MYAFYISIFFTTLFVMLMTAFFVRKFWLKPEEKVIVISVGGETVGVGVGWELEDKPVVDFIYEDIVKTLGYKYREEKRMEFEEKLILLLYIRLDVYDTIYEISNIDYKEMNAVLGYKENGIQKRAYEKYITELLKDVKE